MNISIGRDSITRNEFSIDSTKHINISGMSGMGKSTLLVNLFIEHIRQGNGGLFIDPHGDTADQIAKLIPKSRMRDSSGREPQICHYARAGLPGNVSAPLCKRRVLKTAPHKSPLMSPERTHRPFRRIGTRNRSRRLTSPPFRATSSTAERSPMRPKLGG